VRDAAVRELRDAGLELQLRALEAALQKQLARIHRRVATRALVEQIAVMDDVVRLIGGDAVDIEQIRADVHCEDFDREEDDDRQREAEFRMQANDRIGAQRARSQASGRGAAAAGRQSKRMVR
jgi:hypothetical protein